MSPLLCQKLPSDIHMVLNTQHNECVGVFSTWIGCQILIEQKEWN